MVRHRQRFYLDKENAKLAGVCAGIADHFDWNVKFIRLGWIVATVLWPPMMIVGYVLIAWLADPKPHAGFSRSDVGTSADIPTPPQPLHRRLSEAKSRFDRLEKRLRTIESVVTSREFQMDSELRGAGKTS